MGENARRTVANEGGRTDGPEVSLDVSGGRLDVRRSIAVAVASDNFVADVEGEDIVILVEGLFHSSTRVRQSAIGLGSRTSLKN